MRNIVPVCWLWGNTGIGPWSLIRFRKVGYLMASRSPSDCWAVCLRFEGYLVPVGLGKILAPLAELILFGFSLRYALFSLDFYDFGFQFEYTIVPWEDLMISTLQCHDIISMCVGNWCTFCSFPVFYSKPELYFRFLTWRVCIYQWFFFLEGTFNRCESLIIFPLYSISSFVFYPCM